MRRISKRPKNKLNFHPRSSSTSIMRLWYNNGHASFEKKNVSGLMFGGGGGFFLFYSTRSHKGKRRITWKAVLLGGDRKPCLLVRRDYQCYHLANVCYHEGGYTKDHIFTWQCILHYLVTNSQRDQLPFILLIRLVEHSIGIADRRPTYC